ncbi:MAG TPA: AMP-binding protein [Acidimicrobiales bacterium]|nr:AMP-binding protein [Acidimicrobiales bacterium]
MTATEEFRAARDLLVELRADYPAAYQRFRWPRLEEFNWGIDWFDAVAAAESGRPALRVVDEDGGQTSATYGEMSRRSNQVANWLREMGVGRGDRVLVVLGNVAPLWETFLAAIKLGAVIIPATTLLAPADLADRVERGHVRHVVAEAAQAPKFEKLGQGLTKVAVGAPGQEPPAGWTDYADAGSAPTTFSPDGMSRGADTLLLYFTSGTTALPKLVEHTQVSYPVGHLSTMYWIGLQPGDVHLNLSSPGWAKHAWSNVFAPWNAEATALVYNYSRFSAAALLDVMSGAGVTTFCAPPTVWRMLIQEDLGKWHVPLREAVSAGEPLNPEVIEQVQRKWGITVRDGYGQTETTCMVGNPPGQPLKPGSMGRPLPGYRIELVDPINDQIAGEGEITVVLEERPVGLMVGYRDDPARSEEVMRHGYYHTGDVASRDSEGYLTYVGRADDVFKASDYRISPFELESVLVEHPAVAEAAVVPSPDPLRLAVPKAYVILAAGWAAEPATALDILRHCRAVLAPFKRVRRLEFVEELPKTISGKIRRVELRGREAQLHPGGPPAKAGDEFWDDDFPELRSPA